MLYRLLMRVAAVLLIIPLLGLLLLVFAPAALVAALAWIFKPGPHD